ncbi:MAG: tRNA (pseudouridine(54)-N(1))-methyltransferase [Methanoregula sp. PtaU1.Bin051]|nr:MAG: tRNA (pseudouridine(54)-N(1))-methyltransferase [Methanoregula sp. PtaU1.Bin051]
MVSFVVIGHTARTDGTFSLNDLAGGAGRMDVLCRCVNASLLLSHGVREDNDCSLVLLGSPSPPKTVKFSGNTVRSLNPDERSPAAFLKKALAIPCGSEFREAAPGVAVRKGGLNRLLQEGSYAVLDENGTDIRNVNLLPSAFLLSDHRNFTDDEKALIEDCPRFSVGPAVLHADHAITILLNEIDRRNAGWR